VSTSGGSTLNAVLYLVMLTCSIRVGSLLLGKDLGQLLRRPPAMAAVLWLIVAIPSLSQIAFPGLLRALQRDPDMIRRDGEWWRIITSAVVQDGGIAGTAFNLAVLAVIGVLAIRAWGARRAMTICLLVLLAFNLAATFVWPSAGAGNSAATFGLATSMIGLALIVRRQPAILLLAGLTTADGIALLALADAHGEVVVGGLLVGLFFGRLWAPNAIVVKPA
jgi:hypothetical protein